MSARSRYERLARNRNQFLQRARHNSLLTIPSLVPLEGRTGDSHLLEPYQSLGAELVTHLASRMATALIPAGRPYLRLDLPPAVKLQELANNDGEIPADTAKHLALSENLAQSEVELKGWRGTTRQTLEQLIVAGSAIEYILPESNRIRVYKLDQFVVVLDHEGNVLEEIILEKFDKENLPPDLIGAVTQDAPSAVASSPNDAAAGDEIELYTWIKREVREGTIIYTRRQELGNGVEITEAAAEWLEEDFPYIYLRWSATPGEDYGRAKVSEHIADLRSLDALEKGSLEFAAMASRWFTMVRPGATSTGLRSRLVKAVNGDVVIGDPESVDLKSFESPNGYAISREHVAVLMERLSRAFLLGSVGQRDAERVTAREIERDIQEIEAALGGVFGTLAQDMMLRRTEILLENMKEQKKFPPVEKGLIEPVILTGLEALSRERDVSRAMQAAEIIQAFGGDALDVVKVDKILSKAFLGLGFDDSVHDEAKVQQIRQDRAQREALQQGIAGAIPQIAKEGANE